VSSRRWPTILVASCFVFIALAVWFLPVSATVGREVGVHCGAPVMGTTSADVEDDAPCADARGSRQRIGGTIFAAGLNVLIAGDLLYRWSSVDLGSQSFPGLGDG
jgi:hypothetical protein